MRAFQVAVLLAVVVTAMSASAQEREDFRRFPERAERWVRQLANDLDHLQEDLVYERGRYPRGLRERVDEAARAVAHFHNMLRQNADPEHLRSDFERMDQHVHRLVRELDNTGDVWLRRQASRLNYADEQIHFVLERREGRGFSRELLERQVNVLFDEARDLQEVTRRVTRRNDQLFQAVREFTDEVQHFHEVVHERGDRQHIRNDFEQVDQSWHRVVQLINRSSYGYYLRSAAQNVNRIHNQIDGLLNDRGEPVSANPPPVRPPERPRRPALEFEIPGIGRFVIPQ